MPARPCVRLWQTPRKPSARWRCTGPALESVFQALRKKSRDLRLAGFVSASGSAGTLAAGDYLKANGLVRQRPHPFPLHKKWEAAGRHGEAELFRALAQLADFEVKRKSGGLPVDVALETFLLTRAR